MIHRDANRVESRRARRTTHLPEVQHNAARNDWSMASCWCGWSWHGKGRQAANDAADAHRIFTHDTGAYLCGAKGCRTDRALISLRQRLGLDRSCGGHATPNRLRNLGTSPVMRIPEIVE